MRIRPFAIERFYQRWEFETELMLSSSDCESQSVGQLLALEPDAHERLLGLDLHYTEVPGSAELRAVIASQHTEIDSSEVLVLAAAEEGIFLTYHALIEPGDHVIVERPCYESAFELPRSVGAVVSEWRRTAENGWAYDLDELEALLRPRTRLIYVNSPNNPTGAQMSHRDFERLVEIAREESIVLFSDEVYRMLEHDVGDRLPAACDAYENAVSLNTVSKAYGLPGLRIGWIATRNTALRERIAEFKLYTTICSSAPSELLVALALRHAGKLCERSQRLIAANLMIVDDFLSRRGDKFEWIRPTAGPVGFPKVCAERDVEAWCERVATEAGVLLLPGTVFDEPRHLRLGFGRADLPEAVSRLDQYLDGGV